MRFSIIHYWTRGMWGETYIENGTTSTTGFMKRSAN